MKNFLLFVSLFLFTGAQCFSQQVPREQVVLEIGTGTWCQYCPGAAMGAEDLIDNGYNVAVIEYHNGDDYTNTASNYRNNFYSTTGYPTAHFDGLLPVVGGSSTQSMYTSYLPKVNQRNNVLSSFTISMTGSVTARNYSIQVVTNKVALVSNSSYKLHLVLTESKIQESWQGMSELNFVERLMVPDHLGTSLNFASQSTFTTNLTFSVPEDWDISNCELVAFLQDNSTKEIQQGIKAPLSVFLPTLNLDLAMAGIANVPANVALGRLSPQIVLRNDGATDLTSATITYNVNGGTPMTYNWTGNMPYLGKDTLLLPEITFTPQTSNSLEVSVSNPNGQPDQYPGNNTQSVGFGQSSVYYQAPVTLVLRTDNRPLETTWKLLNSAGDAILTGGPYTDPNKVNVIPLNIPENGAYRFVIHDTGGDGICCKNGNGLYKIADKTSQAIYTGSTFMLEETVDFLVSGITGLQDEVGDQMNVSPNPATDYVRVTLPAELNGRLTVKLNDLSGRTVYNNILNYKNSLIIPVTGMAKGMYILQVSSGDYTITRKVNVQ